MLQKLALNLLASGLPEFVIPLIAVLVGVVIVVAVVVAITVVRAKRKKKEQLDIEPIVFEPHKKPEQIADNSEQEVAQSQDNSPLITEELEDMQKELSDIHDELNQLGGEQQEEVAEELTEQPAEEVAEEETEVVEEQAEVVETEEQLTLIDTEEVETSEEVTEEVAEATEEVTEEVVEEQPEEDELAEQLTIDEEVTEEVAEQPEEEVTEEVAEEVVEEVVEEQPEIVEEPLVQPVEEVAHVTELEEEVGVVRSVNTSTGLAVIVRYKKSYRAKYIQAKDETKSYYTLLKNALLSYKKVKSRISWSHENFNSGRNNIARFTMRGKSLCVYFALNPDDYIDTKYKVERSPSKKYEGVPCLYRIKNARRAKYALDLIAALMEKYGLVKGEEQNENYYLPYEPTGQLVEEGLIKELISEEDYNEFIRLRNERTMLAEEEAAAAEAEEIEEVEEPEIVEEVTEVVVEEVVEDETCEQPEIVEEVSEVVVEEVVEEQPEEEQPAEVEAVEEPVEEEQPEEEVPEHVFREQSRQEVEEKLREEVSAEEVNDIIADKTAVALVEKRHGAIAGAGKKAIINIDVLSKNFKKNEVVSLESLKDKKLIPANVCRVKVLARGTLTKPLIVEAHDFSIEAVKMIVVTGGKAVKV